MENDSFIRIEAEQDGVQIILEFPETLMETGNEAEDALMKQKFHPDVQRILSHVLKNKLRREEMDHGEGLSR